MRWETLIRRRIGTYLILDELDQGAVTRTFRAFDYEGERLVAFKVLPLDDDDIRRFVQRFIREVAVMRALEHPNILPVYEGGEMEDFVYLVMQAYTGGNLAGRIRVGSLDTQEACQYAIQVASALNYAHSKGIVHRDVTPSNVVLDEKDSKRVLLSGFGMAKLLIANEYTRTRPGALIGTVEYMPPEQAEGREVDQRSDVYSLGCMLYEMLAGRPPFVGATAISVLYQQSHAQPMYIRSYNVKVPRELWAVMRKCLAKAPLERYQSAADLATDLKPFADGLIKADIAAPQPDAMDVTTGPVSELPIPSLTSAEGPLSKRSLAPAHIHAAVSDPARPVFFISYRHDDSAGHTGRLGDSLKARYGKQQVFMDQGMQPGTDFVSTLEHAVRSCSAVLAVIGRRWLKVADSSTGRRRLDDPKDWVRIEISTALRLGIPVIPILVDQARMPKEASLPDDLRLLARRQAHEMSDMRWDYDLEILGQRLDNLATLASQ